MSPQRILITGGAGFIGSNLACHLQRAFPSAQIVCMDNLYRRGSELNVVRLQDRGIHCHRGDIRSLDDEFEEICEAFQREKYVK